MSIEAAVVKSLCKRRASLRRKEKSAVQNRNAPHVEHDRTARVLERARSGSRPAPAEEAGPHVRGVGEVDGEGD